MPEITPEQRAAAIETLQEEIVEAGGVLVVQVHLAAAVDQLVAAGWTPPSTGAVPHFGAVEVCPICDIAGCRHIREKEASDHEARYGAIAEMIHANGPGGVVDVDVATKASAYRTLNWLRRIKAEPPRIFSHGGDAVVFTWDRKGSSHLLTICDRLMVLSEMPRAVPQPGEGGNA